LLSIGLVCEILFAPQGRTHLGIAQARARLEPYLAGRMLSTEVGSRWFQAAAAVLNTLSEPDQRTYLDRTVPARTNHEPIPPLAQSDDGIALGEVSFNWPTGDQAPLALTRGHRLRHRRRICRLGAPLFDRG
jgi:hypothetical protein